jgi:hypothetical protein
VAQFDRCAELPGVDLTTVQQLAANVEPDICADGTKVWSLIGLSASSARGLPPAPWRLARPQTNASHRRIGTAALYRSIPGRRVISREQSREHWGSWSRPVADAWGTPVPPLPLTDRPAGHGKADASLDRPRACKAGLGAAATCEGEERHRSRLLRGCPWLSAWDRSGLQRMARWWHGRRGSLVVQRFPVGFYLTVR